MFYYVMAPFLSFNAVLIIAAIIPALFLMLKVYKSDKLEKESNYLLWNLVKVGIFSSLLALVEEKVLFVLLDLTVPQESVLYNIILYFGIVAFAEESSKYLFMKKETWKNPEFNCQYDGVVYAVFVSLGFALWENISYVLNFGFSTAVVRAVTAIPGHACFGVFMGVLYGAARRYQDYGLTALSKIFRVFSVLIPALLHGAYDYIASMEQMQSGWYFAGFIAVLFAISYFVAVTASKKDRYI